MAGSLLASILSVATAFEPFYAVYQIMATAILVLPSPLPALLFWPAPLLVALRCLLDFPLWLWDAITIVIFVDIPRAI